MSEASTAPEHLARAVEITCYTYIVLLLLGGVVQAILCSYALVKFKQDPVKHGGKQARLLAFSFAISIFYSIAALAQVWERSVKLSDPSKILIPDSIPVRGVTNTFTTIYICLGECLMLWRCYVVWKTRKWVVSIPLLFFLASFGLSIFALAQSLQVRSKATGLLAGILWLASSVATNMIITFLIIMKLAVARRQMCSTSSNLSNLCRDLIIILVESATPLAVAGLCTVAGFATTLSEGALTKGVPSEGLYLFVMISEVLCFIFGALSPQMIIFRMLLCVPRGLVVQDVRQDDPESAQFSTIHYIP